MTARQWLKIIGPRADEELQPFQCGAPWTAFANDIELRRLARLQARIKRRERALAEMKSERGTIMARCIRRMRRSKGMN